MGFTGLFVFSGFFAFSTSLGKTVILQLRLCQNANNTNKTSVPANPSK